MGSFLLLTFLFFLLSSEGQIVIMDYYCKLEYLLKRRFQGLTHGTHACWGILLKCLLVYLIRNFNSFGFYSYALI